VGWLGYARDELISPRPLEECVARLQEAVGGMFDNGPVIGRVDERSLRIRKRLQNAKNSFQTFLHATLERNGGATRISCRFGPHPLVLGFMVFWLVSAAAIGIAFWTLGLPSANGGQIPIIVRVMPFLMMPMGLAMVFIGRYWARHERQFLLDFLRETVEAKPQQATSSARTAPVIER